MTEKTAELVQAEHDAYQARMLAETHRQTKALASIRRSLNLLVAIVVVLLLLAFIAAGR